MIEPTIALQTAMRAALIATPAVIDLVPAEHIRAGSTRPDKLPCIIMSDGSTRFHGHDYSRTRLAWIDLDIHVWTIDQGQEAAKSIAFAVRNALDKAPPIDGCDIEEFKITRAAFPRDPKPEYGHGVLSVEALIRWGI